MGWCRLLAGHSFEEILRLEKSQVGALGAEFLDGRDPHVRVALEDEHRQFPDGERVFVEHGDLVQIERVVEGGVNFAVAVVGFDVLPEEILQRAVLTDVRERSEEQIRHRRRRGQRKDFALDLEQIEAFPGRVFALEWAKTPTLEEHNHLSGHVNPFVI